MNRRTLIAGGTVVAGACAASVEEWRRMGTMTAYDAAVDVERRPVAHQPELVSLVRQAILAPSGHNTQPWRFRIGERRIDIFADLSRRTPVVDPDDHHLFVSLGCAAETLAIAAAARGKPGVLVDDLASSSIGFVFGDGQATPSGMADAIGRRQSTRAVYDGTPDDAAMLDDLARAAAVPGVDLVLLTDRAAMARVRDLVLSGNSTQMADPAFVRELKAWMRFSPRRAARTGDGLFSATSGQPILPNWAGPMLFGQFVSARSENDAYSAQLASSSGIAVFVGAHDDREHWVRAGRACQRFALKATALGLKLAFMNQPVEVAGLRPALAALAGLPGRRPDIVMRFGRGPALPYSARRPVDAALV